MFSFPVEHLIPWSLPFVVAKGYPAMDLNAEKIGRLVRELLIEIGEDPVREGLLNTPQRVAKALTFLHFRISYRR